MAAAALQGRQLEGRKRIHVLCAVTGKLRAFPERSLDPEVFKEQPEHRNAVLKSQ